MYGGAFFRYFPREKRKEKKKTSCVFFGKKVWFLIATKREKTKREEKNVRLKQTQLIDLGGKSKTVVSTNKRNERDDDSFVLRWRRKNKNKNKKIEREKGEGREVYFY